jgi:hypothetical protein
MPGAEAIRTEIQRLLRAVPFRPFALNLENGDRVIIEHPENIAFDPPSHEGVGGSEDFYVLSSRLRLYTTFGAVTSVVLVDRGELASQES